MKDWRRDQNDRLGLDWKVIFNPNYRVITLSVRFNWLKNYSNGNIYIN